MGADREAIVDVLVRYARAIDTKDWARFRTCFADDVAADYGDLGAWQGLDDLTAFMVSAHEAMGPTQHLVSNFEVTLDGDRAEAVSSVHAVLVSSSDPDRWIDGIGTYEDELVREAAGWRITRRTFRMTRRIVSPPGPSADATAPRSR